MYCIYIIYVLKNIFFVSKMSQQQRRQHTKKVFPREIITHILEYLDGMEDVEQMWQSVPPWLNKLHVMEMLLHYKMDLMRRYNRGRSHNPGPELTRKTKNASDILQIQKILLRYKSMQLKVLDIFLFQNIFKTLHQTLIILII